LLILYLIPITISVLALLPIQTTYIPPELIKPIEVILEAPTEPVLKKETEPSDTVLCNCWAFVKQEVGGIDAMASVIPNTEPFVDVVAIEWFGDVKHVSIVTQVTDIGVTIRETNFVHCQYGERFIPFTSPRLVGFWSAK